MQITNHRKCQNPLRPGISTSMSTTKLCLPNTACQWSVVCYYRISQIGPRNETEYSLLSVCLCLTVWLCLKIGSRTMVLMRLLEVGAKDPTVPQPSRDATLSQTTPLPHALPHPIPTPDAVTIWQCIAFISDSTNLLHNNKNLPCRRQEQTLPNATPPVSIIRPSAKFTTLLTKRCKYNDLYI